MGRHSFLEAFDLYQEPQPAAGAGPSEDWLAGYAAGRAEAEAELDQTVATQRATVVQAIADMSFGFHEARQHLIGALKPMVEAILDPILPEFARATLLPIVVERLVEAAEADTRAPLRLLVNPAVEPDLAPWIAEAPGLPVTVVADPTLPEGRLHILGADGSGTALDAEALLDETRAALSALLTQPQLRLDHG